MHIINMITAQIQRDDIFDSLSTVSYTHLYFQTPVTKIERLGDNNYRIHYHDTFADCTKCVVSVGRIGSKWMESICKDLEIPTNSNRVDLGVRVELPAVIFSDLTDAVSYTHLQK